MGDFRVVIEGAGGHGCQREVKSGGQVVGCGQETCPDCTARELVKKLQLYSHVTKAEFQHWPADHENYKGKPDAMKQVTDNLLTGIRQGDFPPSI